MTSETLVYCKATAEQKGAKVPKVVMVTGGAGFLGSHLIDLLLELGSFVICVDQFQTGSRENLKHLAGNKNFQILEHDVVNPFDTSKGMISKIEQIYHLACPASPVHYQADEVRTLRTSFEGTKNVLELAEKLKCRVMISSTSEVYGDPLQHPQTEEYWGNVSCTGIRSCYDEGKRVAEALAMSFHRQHKVDVRISRIFNTYGPRMAFNDGRVVSNFISQALQKQPITVYGDGKQSRSFCFVSDLIDGLWRLMNSSSAEAVANPINIGNPGEFTIQQLADLVKKHVGDQVAVVHKTLPKDDPKTRCPVIAKAQKILGWTPKITLDQGLDLTVPDFRERLKVMGGKAEILHQSTAN